MSGVDRGRGGGGEKGLEPQVSFFNYIFLYLYTKECLVIGDSYE